MESARRGLQIVRFAMLISIVLYFVIVRIVPSHANPNPMVFRVLALIGFLNLGALILLRKQLVRKPVEALRSHPQDSAALARWKSGQLITWAFSESIAVYGLVLHFLSAGQVVPFFVAGALLIVVFPPNLPDASG